MTSKAKAPRVSTGAFLLKKSQLFRKPDFTKLFAVSTKKQGRYFVMYYQKAASDAPSLGIVISKKHARTSIQRNLAKRLVREHFRLQQHDLKSWQILMLAKSGIMRASRAELHQDIEQLFSFLKKIS
jgi:ribonuclease P protein component